MFKPRTKAPSKDNDCYYSSKNVFVKYHYPLPNCTTHVEGRCLEEWGEPSGCLHNAGGWIEEAKKAGRKISNTPALGAIAVWKIPGTEDSGHVAFTEDVLVNVNIECSNSASKGTLFYMQTFEAAQNYDWVSNITGKKYEFQGFILPPKELLEEEKTMTVTASIQFRHTPADFKNRYPNLEKCAVVKYLGSFQVIKLNKWLHVSYESLEGWINSKYVK